MVLTVAEHDGSPGCLGVPSEWAYYLGHLERRGEPGKQPPKSGRQDLQGKREPAEWAPCIRLAELGASIDLPHRIQRKGNLLNET